MNSNKIIALLLLSVMLFAGCAKTVLTVSENTSAEVNESTETAAAEDADSLPELNYGGADVNILVQDYGGYCGIDFFNEGMNGEIVNDAIYERNKNVSERLSMNLIWTQHTHQWSNHNEYLQFVRSSVMAGGGEYDLLAGLGYFLPMFVIDGILQPLSGLPYIDIKKPWWSADFMKNSSIDGEYYLATGDACLGLIKYMFCIYQNIDLCNSLGLSDNTYETVKNGEWTLDKLNSMITGSYSDLNGNGKIDTEDQFGLLATRENTITGFVEPFEISYVEFQDNEAKFIFDNERNFTVMERLYDFIWNNDYVFYDKNNSSSELADESLFKNGNVALSLGWLAHTDSFRDLDFDYGILPYPKYDESQDGYKTTVLTTYSVLGIPKDCKDSERVAALMEAMGSESYRTVTPAYFEIALKVKYSTSDEMSQIFDLIRDGIDFDFGYIYTAALDGMSDSYFRAFIAGKNSKWVSNAAAKKEGTQIKLDELVEMIRSKN